MIAPKKMNCYPRASGILLHITSLPSRYGIGDLGQGAYDFIDFLAAAGQRYWQFLPLGPVDSVFGCSPYMALSAMAGNYLLIDPESLCGEGLLADSDLDLPGFSEYIVEFERVAGHKAALLQKAFDNFQHNGQKDDFAIFCTAESGWLDDYALFMSIRQAHNNRAWNVWPKGLAQRTAAEIAQATDDLSETVLYYKFEQYCFYRQWRRLRAYAHRKGIDLIGDLPIYVSYDSADVWGNQSCFLLDPVTLAPTYVAGVPPDYFSDTGQRWGNPIYQWETGKKKNKVLYDWWRLRFKQLCQVVDIVRIDHFRGFESYWQVPEHEETAMNGSWVKGPGLNFFEEMDAVIADLPIIAEDLGIITSDVEKLRDELDLPGMKILQFAFDSDEKNLYLPHNLTNPNCVIYTGTHDNDTSLGWFMGSDGSPESKDRVRRYANSDGSNIHWDFIRLAFSSVANTAIVPLQDVLGFGADCRMNKPGTAQNNWRWRCAPRFMTAEIAGRLRDETMFYGRLNQRSNHGEANV